MALSNNLTAILNLIAFLCSIPIIASGIWLASQPDNECIHFYRWPLVLLGVLVLVVSLTGFVGGYCYKETLLAFYLCCMAILIILLLVLLVFALVVTRPDGSVYVPGRGYKEFRIDGFSAWLRDHVVDSRDWVGIRACLAESGTCSKLSTTYFSADQFFAGHISPIQSGCCKPPTVCGYNYVNPSMWVNPANPTADPDCYMWSNEHSQLCYNCNSCKAGLLGNLRKEWRKINTILIVAVVILIFVYVVACFAFKNAQMGPSRGSK
ncbi:TET2 [Linum perenne]